MGALQAKHLTREQFAMNHPAGRIGRRLILRVGDCMLAGASIPVASPGDSIMGCLQELTSKACGCVLVTGPQQQLLGTFTDGDLRRTLQAQGPGLFDMRVRKDHFLIISSSLMTTGLSSTTGKD